MARNHKTLGDVIADLEQLREVHGDRCEVRIINPFKDTTLERALGGVFDVLPGPDDVIEDGLATPVVYLAGGRVLGELPRRVLEAA